MANVKINEHELRVLRSFQERILNESSPNRLRDNIFKIVMSTFNYWNGDNPISIMSDDFYLLENLYDLMNDIEYSKEGLSHMKINEYNLPDFIRKSLEQGKYFQLNFPNGDVWVYYYSYIKHKGIISPTYNKKDGRNACMQDDRLVSMKELSEEIITNWSNVVRIY